MKQKLIDNVMQGVLRILNNLQAAQLQKVLESELAKVEVTKYEETVEDVKRNNVDFIEMFLAAKRVEGCSEKSLKYYNVTIEAMLNTIEKQVQEIDTNDLRTYLTEYQSRKNSSRVTIDNIRRILSSFFSWLEDEDYILKSPVRRIHKVKATSTVKDTYSDEALETMRDNCENIRDLALIDMLASTGMRVGELVLLTAMIRR
ncbi:MAG: phage integrase N-terminal SAM-like domain-containing protein [Lachnospiraceae bacterium]